MKHVPVLLSILALCALIAGAGCSGGSSSGNSPTSSSSKEITAFGIVSPFSTGTIDESAKTVAVTVPSGTAVTALVATFTTTGVKTTVGTVEQISGITVNNFTSPVTYTVTAADGSTKSYTVTVTAASISAKAITVFTILGNNGTIAGTNITVILPSGTSLTSLIPTITYTGASISPASGVSQDFTNPVVYTVTAADGSTVAYTVTVTASPSSAKEITAFTILGNNGTISGTNITLTLPYGTSLTALTPTITYTGASINPASGVARNFTNSVTYTVTATDGTTAVYTVKVTAAPSSAKTITAFTILGVNGTITGTNIALTLPSGTALTSLTPTITHTGKSISPASGVAQNFTNSVPYTVTAADGTTAVYTATVTAAPSSSKTITAFTILGMSGTISGTSIALTLPYGTSPTALTPTIIHTGASISPASGVAKDFTNPVAYTVTAADGSTAVYTVTVTIIMTKPLSLSGAVTTLAGYPVTSADGTGSAAMFKNPQGITTDGFNLYIADRDNNEIRKIVIATGVVTTLAGSTSYGHADGTGTAASFFYPQGITIDSTGTNLYVADTINNEIQKIVIATGVVTTLAGSTTSGHADGTGSAASFNWPCGITIDSTGTNLYVADSNNHEIRKIVIATGVVSTLSGSTTSGHADGTGTAASFYGPEGITIDSSGTFLYVADSDNNEIRKIVIATGEVTTFAGSTSYGHTDATGTAAKFNYPTGITTDGTNLYVADSWNLEIRKIIISTGAVTTLAGSTSMYGHADGTGTAASFYNPYGITTDGTNLFVADSQNYEIRKIVISTGVVTTLAGLPPVSSNTNGTGSAARFYAPVGVATDGTYLYVADSQNMQIRKIAASTGVVTTLAGSACGSNNGTGTAASFNWPMGITIDSTLTNLYVSDTANNMIRKIVIATGVVTTVAGSTTSGSSNGTGTAASFNFPAGIAIDSTGTNLYVADANNSEIRKIVIATGVVTTFAGYITGGHIDGTGTASRFSSPMGITTDGTNLYVADSGNNDIRKIVIATGVVTTLAGSTSTGHADGTGTAASFYFPQGITTDGTNLYVSDSNNNEIRKIVIATGVVTTLAGSTVRGYADGTGTAAGFYSPQGITTDGTSLYVADSNNNTIRVIK